MILHIVRRELYDHLNSLRFALTVLILVILMVTNAFVHLQHYPERIRKYSRNVITYRDELSSQKHLYPLLKKGPGKLYKRPSSLAFIADGSDAFLPDRIASDGGSWEKNVLGTAVKSIWWLEYPTSNPNARDIRPKAVVIDWAFIIIYLLSFIPLLFTFDALSGERERGTLRLCLANPVSRPVLLLGKFLGTFITVLIPFFFAVLLNLAIISTDEWTRLAEEDLVRLGVIVLIASCYAGIFIAMGLMVSAGTRESRVSLVVVVLVWVTLVVFMPSTLGTLATKWMMPAQTQHQLQGAKDVAIAQIDTDFKNKLKSTKTSRLQNGEFFNKLRQLAKLPSEEATRRAALLEMEKEGNEELYLVAERINKDVNIRERLNRAHLTAQISQVQQGRRIARLSPAAVVQYTLESMAGTGLTRHLQFMERVHLHTRAFRDFITEMDRGDTQSLHIIGIPEGMSKKSISSAALPVFGDQITFRDTLSMATVDILLLVLLLGLLLLGAFLVFLRAAV